MAEAFYSAVLLELAVLSKRWMDECDGARVDIDIEFN